MRDEWERVAAPITASHYCLAASPRPLLPHPPPCSGVSPTDFECERVFIYGSNYGLSAIFARLSSGVGGGGAACVCSCVCGMKKKKEKKSERSNNYVYVRQWKNPGVVMISNYKILFSGISRGHCASRQVQFARL